MSGREVKEKGLWCPGLMGVCGKGTPGLRGEGERRNGAMEETWGWHWVLVHEMGQPKHNFGVESSPATV